MKIVVTGGCGYIGSHTVLELLRAGHDVVVVDNLSNSSQQSLAAVERLTGRTVTFFRVDLRDRTGLDAVFRAHDIDGVVHFAGAKSVPESVIDPLAYYDNNVHGSTVLLQVMRDRGVRRIVFSSSATVYAHRAYRSTQKRHRHRQ